jgi:hypothetical protein
VRTPPFPPEFLDAPVQEYFHAGTFCSPLLVETEWSRWGSSRPGALHAFVDDYRLEVSWRRPSLALRRALAAQIVTSPDFSAGWDHPAEFVHWQSYRSSMVSAYWRANGVQVLPVLLWSETVSSVRIAAQSAVAVRGPGSSLVEQGRWFQGFKRMVREIDPSQVWIFGRVPPGLVGLVGAPILQVKTHGGQGLQIG